MSMDGLCRLYEVGRRRPSEADSDNDDMGDDLDDDSDGQVRVCDNCSPSISDCLLERGIEISSFSAP